jgi:hypothetical protein
MKKKTKIILKKGAKLRGLWQGLKKKWGRYRWLVLFIGNTLE